MNAEQKYPNLPVEQLRSLCGMLKQYAELNTRTADYIYSDLNNAVRKIVAHATGKELGDVNWGGSGTWYDDLMLAIESL